MYSARTKKKNSVQILLSSLNWILLGAWVKNCFASKSRVTPRGPLPSFHPDMAHPLGKGESACGLDENFSIYGALGGQHITAAYLCFTFRRVFFFPRVLGLHTPLAPPPLPGFPVV